MDFGMARIGLSYSDVSKTIASPLGIMNAEKKTTVTLQKLIKILEDHQRELDYHLEKIIVGLPLMMSGQTGWMADEVNHFVELMQKALPDISIETWDERLSSVQAERSMKEANLSRKKRAKRVDSVAAVIILQSYLDRECMRFETLPPLPPLA